jgi:transcriptional regulator with XRE-family HTH domain
MDRAERVSNGTLAARLRELRQNANLTQKHLADAFGTSVPLISSWESGAAAPPQRRLQQYATFFADERSDNGGNDGVALDADVILEDLTNLRSRGDGRQPLRPQADTIGGGLWHFADGRPITIICSVLPADDRRDIKNAEPSTPDYVSAYRYSDLDALIELHGHIRAVNPASQVNIRAGDDVAEDDTTTHVVLLGGVDWNRAARDFLQLAQLPVRQSERTEDDGAGYFYVGEGKDRQTFAPALQATAGDPQLLWDVALFYRGPNPYNALRTVTMCNGMYSRGTYGAVRALTDARFRDRNEAYVTKRFGDSRAFGVVSKVSIYANRTITPDWNVRGQRLYDWSGDSPSARN